MSTITRRALSLALAAILAATVNVTAFAASPVSGIVASIEIAIPGEDGRTFTLTNVYEKYYVRTAESGSATYFFILSNGTLASNKPLSEYMFGDESYTPQSEPLKIKSSGGVPTYGGKYGEYSLGGVALLKDGADKFLELNFIGVDSQEQLEALQLWLKMDSFSIADLKTAPPLTATPSKTAFVMDGKPVSVPQAYEVGNSNYLQLRAIAVLLNGTAAQFDVSYDGKYAVIETGKPYTGAANAATLQATTNVRKSDTAFKIDGNIVTFDKAYLIDGNTNYLQLREVAEKLSGTKSQFNIYWDSGLSQAVIEPGKEYTGNPSASLGVNADEVKKAFSAYTGFLKKQGETKYMIADMCGDEIPELLVLESAPSDPYVYACVYDKSLNLLVRQAVADEGGGGTGGAVFTTQNGDFYVANSQSYQDSAYQWYLSDITFTKYRFDGKLSVAETLQSSQQSGTTSYSRNGKQITEAEYRQLRSAITGSVSAVFYDSASSIVTKSGQWIPSWLGATVCLVGKVETVQFDGRNVYALNLASGEQETSHHPVLLISIGVTAFATPDFVGKNVIVIGDIAPGRGNEGYLTMTYMEEVASK